MSDKGLETRERILATAEPLILRQGFAGTSLDDILKGSGLTKGAFFHHFTGKADLARALVERYALNDFAVFDRLAEEADAATEDPLERAFLFLKLFEDFIERLPEAPAGCLLAAYVYEGVQFDASIHRFINDIFRRWAALYETKFEAVLKTYRPARPVSARELADMIIAIIEGGFILTRTYSDKTIIARQSRQFRQYLELLFAPDGPAVRVRPRRKAE